MISAEGKQFIESMRGYLISYGVEESDLESFLAEAEDHIIEGEQDGKTVDDIFGKSPKRYAKELTSVLDVSKKENFKLITQLITTIFALVLVFSLTHSSLELSYFQLVGYPISMILWIIFLIIALRLSAFKSKTSEFIITYGIVLVPSAVTVGVIYFSQYYNDPFLTIDGMGRFVAIAILTIILIINFTSLFNFKFGVSFVLLMIGSLMLFEVFNLGAYMYSEFRFILPGIIAYLMWRFYGRRILLEQK